MGFICPCGLIWSCYSHRPQAGPGNFHDPFMTPESSRFLQSFGGHACTLSGDNGGSTSRGFSCRGGNWGPRIDEVSDLLFGCPPARGPHWPKSCTLGKAFLLALSFFALV